MRMPGTLAHKSAAFLCHPAAMDAKLFRVSAWLFCYYSDAQAEDKADDKDRGNRPLGILILPAYGMRTERVDFCDLAVTRRGIVFASLRTPSRTPEPMQRGSAN